MPTKSKKNDGLLPFMEGTTKEAKDTTKSEKDVEVSNTHIPSPMESTREKRTSASTPEPAKESRATQPSETAVNVAPERETHEQLPANITNPQETQASTKKEVNEEGEESETKSTPSMPNDPPSLTPKEEKSKANSRTKISIGKRGIPIESVEAVENRVARIREATNRHYSAGEFYADLEKHFGDYAEELIKRRIRGENVKVRCKITAHSTSRKSAEEIGSSKKNGKDQSTMVKRSKRGDENKG